MVAEQIEHELNRQDSTESFNLCRLAKDNSDLAMKIPTNRLVDIIQNARNPHRTLEVLAEVNSDLVMKIPTDKVVEIINNAPSTPAAESDVVALSNLANVNPDFVMSLPLEFLKNLYQQTQGPYMYLSSNFWGSLFQETTEDEKAKSVGVSGGMFALQWEILKLTVPEGFEPNSEDLQRLVRAVKELIITDNITPSKIKLVEKIPKQSPSYVSKPSLFSDAFSDPKYSFSNISKPKDSRTTTTAPDNQAGQKTSKPQFRS